MTKVIVELGYNSFVLDAENALKVMDMLNGAERYEYKYRSNDQSSHHIYPAEPGNFSFKLLPEESYKMYKLAGKPEKD